MLCASSSGHRIVRMAKPLMLTGDPSVAVEIRSYQNADAKSCCKLWNDHFASVGMPSNLDVHLWEFAVVGKIFFDCDSLSGGCRWRLSSWICASNASKRRIFAPTHDAVINSLCVRNHSIATPSQGCCLMSYGNGSARNRSRALLLWVHPSGSRPVC